jgi:hypothetical protein
MMQCSNVSELMGAPRRNLRNLIYGAWSAVRPAARAPACSARRVVRGIGGDEFHRPPASTPLVEMLKAIGQETKRNWRVLDVGCAEGARCKWFISSGCDVNGIDIKRGHEQYEGPTRQGRVKFWSVIGVVAELGASLLRNVTLGRAKTWASTGAILRPAEFSTTFRSST